MPAARSLWSMSAVEVAAAVAGGEASAEEVVAGLSARIEQVNPAVHAVVDVRDGAVEEARAVDAALARGERPGPLSGVPISVKAEIDVAGSASTAGTVSQRDRVPQADSPIVARMRAAGAIVLARTNQPDLGLRLHTDSSLYGATLNPWDPSVTPGGSSGGDAVAVATGMVPIGLGSDIGGSLRNPATCCGVAALKPGLGRVPVAYAEDTVASNEQLMCVQGPIARRVADLRVVLDAVSGSDPRDPWAVPSGPGAGGRGPRRIAVSTAPPGGGTDPAVAAAVRRAADALADAGYDVVETDPPGLDQALELWWTVMLLGMETDEPPPSDLELAPGVQAFLALTTMAQGPVIERAMARGGLAGAMAGRHRLGIRWAHFLAEHGCLLGPVWTTPPWPVGYDIADADSAYDVLVRARLTLAANVLGLPAVTVPAGSAGRLPVGVQVVGPAFGEAICLDAAGAVEDALGVLTPIEPRPGG